MQWTEIQLEISSFLEEASRIYRLVSGILGEGLKSCLYSTKIERDSEAVYLWADEGDMDEIARRSVR